MVNYDRIADELGKYFPRLRNTDIYQVGNDIYVLLFRTSDSLCISCIKGKDRSLLARLVFTGEGVEEKLFYGGEAYKNLINNLKDILENT